MDKIALGVVGNGWSQATFRDAQRSIPVLLPATRPEVR